MRTNALYLHTHKCALFTHPDTYTHVDIYVDIYVDKDTYIDIYVDIYVDIDTYIIPTQHNTHPRPHDNPLLCVHRPLDGSPLVSNVLK